MIFKATGNEDSIRTNVTLGEGASCVTAIANGTACFNVTLAIDSIKEGAELFFLRLFSVDSGVWLGRDLAYGIVAPNGGNNSHLSNNYSLYTSIPHFKSICKLLQRWY